MQIRDTLRNLIGGVFRRTSPDDSRDQVHAALFRLSTDLAALLDEEQIFPLVVNALHDTLGYDFLALFLRDDDTPNRTLVACAGFKDPISPLKPGEGLSERPFLDGKLHYSPDVTQEPRFSYGIGGSEVDVPIFLSEQVIGVLIAESKQKDAFHSLDFDVLTAAASITGLAIEKARLFSSERQRSAELEALQDTMNELFAELDLSSLLQSIVERAAGLLDATGGELGLIRETRDEIEIVVSYNLDKNYTGSTHAIGEGLMGRVAATQEALIIEDYPAWSGSLKPYKNIHGALGVPLIAGNQLLGVFSTITSSHERKFNVNDMHLLKLFAQQAAIAIENARLFNQAQDELEERKRIQEAIVRQKEYYQALLINNPVAVVTCDLDGKIVSWNPMAETLFGYSADEVLGGDLDHFVARHEKLREEAAIFTEKVLREERVHASTRRTRWDGSLVDVELLALPVIVAGEKVGIISIYHDVTHTRNKERQLREHNQKMADELALAGRIQQSFLPHKLPTIPGWELATRLESAEETSGDFYDVHVLPNGMIRILIGDVVDKGVGAALIMAMSATLLRTYSSEYPSRPQQVFKIVNQRILEDTHSSQFITVFYGVLDPRTGRLDYCNAGHNPPYIAHSRHGKDPRALIRTGMPLGVSSGETWGQECVMLEADDVMILYTDGITEATNGAGAYFGEERLLQVIQDQAAGSAEHISATLMQEVKDFVSEEAQSDDIGLIVLKQTSDQDHPAAQ